MTLSPWASILFEQEVLDEINQAPLDKIKQWMADNAPKFNEAFDHIFGDKTRIVVPYGGVMPPQLQVLDSFLKGADYEPDYSTGLASRAVETERGPKQVEQKIGKILMRAYKFARRKEDTRIKYDKIFDDLIRKLADDYDGSSGPIDENPEYLKWVRQQMEDFQRIDVDKKRHFGDAVLFTSDIAPKIEYWQKKAEFFRSNPTDVIEADYSIIISRHPIDILRMADFKNIYSCHTPGHDFFSCAMSEAKAGGLIAYAVATEDLEGVDLEQNEVFHDDMRDVGTIAPVSRLRLRMFVSQKDGHAIAMPETHVYGTKLPDFEKKLIDWARAAQKGYLKKHGVDLDNPEMHAKMEDYHLYGGTYTDTSAGTQFDNFFPEDGNTSRFMGDVLHISDVEYDKIEERKQDLMDKVSNTVNRAFSSRPDIAFSVAMPTTLIDDDDTSDEEYYKITVRPRFSHYMPVGYINLPGGRQIANAKRQVEEKMKAAWLQTLVALKISTSSMHFPFSTVRPDRSARLDVAFGPGMPERRAFLRFSSMTEDYNKWEQGVLKWLENADFKSLPGKIKEAFEEAGITAEPDLEGPAGRGRTAPGDRPGVMKSDPRAGNMAEPVMENKQMNPWSKIIMENHIISEVSERYADEIRDWMNDPYKDDYHFDHIFGDKMRVVAPMGTLKHDTVYEIEEFLENANYVINWQEGKAYKPAYDREGVLRPQPMVVKLGKLLNNALKLAEKNEALQEKYRQARADRRDQLVIDIEPLSRAKDDAYNKMRDVEIMWANKRGTYDQEMPPDMHKIYMAAQAEYAAANKPWEERYAEDRKLSDASFNKESDELEKTVTKYWRKAFGYTSPGRPEKYKEWVQFWNSKSELYRNDPENMNEKEYVLIISRHPVDVVRMSDFSHIHSCHSEGGGYFQCAMNEAKGAGLVAYSVLKKDLEGVDLDATEIFEDDDRNVEGIVPGGRVRVRLYEDNHGTEIAVPEHAVYGNNLPTFMEKVMDWAQEAQKPYFKKRGIDLEDQDTLPDMRGFTLSGGNYRDTSAGTMWNDFFETNKYHGDVAFGDDDEDENYVDLDAISEQAQEYINDAERSVNNEIGNAPFGVNFDYNVEEAEGWGDNGYVIWASVNATGRLPDEELSEEFKELTAEEQNTIVVDILHETLGSSFGIDDLSVEQPYAAADDLSFWAQLSFDTQTDIDDFYRELNYFERHDWSDEWPTIEKQLIAAKVFKPDAYTTFANEIIDYVEEHITHFEVEADEDEVIIKQVEPFMVAEVPMHVDLVKIFKNYAAVDVSSETVGSPFNPTMHKISSSPFTQLIHRGYEKYFAEIFKAAEQQMTLPGMKFPKPKMPGIPLDGFKPSLAMYPKRETSGDQPIFFFMDFKYEYDLRKSYNEGSYEMFKKFITYLDKNLDPFVKFAGRAFEKMWEAYIEDHPLNPVNLQKIDADIEYVKTHPRFDLDLPHQRNPQHAKAVQENIKKLEDYLNLHRKSASVGSVPKEIEEIIDKIVGLAEVTKTMEAKMEKNGIKNPWREGWEEVEKTIQGRVADPVPA